MRRRVLARRRQPRRQEINDSNHDDIELQPGKASNVINHNTIHPGDNVVLACRVSGRSQNRGRNNEDQEVGQRIHVKACEATVIGVVKHVGPGDDPSWTEEAAVIARKYDAKILAETTNRFIRHPDYHSVNNFNAQARECDLERLRSCTEGVELVTILHPDASPSEERSYQSKRGHRAGGNTGGRPPVKNSGYMNDRRKKLRPQAVEMHQKGLSLRAIGVKLKVAHTTIDRWIKRVPFIDEGTT